MGVVQSTRLTVLFDAFVAQFAFTLFSVFWSQMTWYGVSLKTFGDLSDFSI